MKGNSGLYKVYEKSSSTKNVIEFESLNKSQNFISGDGDKSSNSKEIKTPQKRSKVSDKGLKIMQKVHNQSLKNAIAELYRNSSDKVGDGSTASALKKEYKTGQKIKGKNHIMKAEERIRHMSRLINSGVLDKSDTKIAKREIKKLQKALNLFKKGKK